MNRSGIGVGSASIVLIFAVLCLTVFSLISLLVAKNNKSLSDTEAALVVGYYEADAKAEKMLAELIEADGHTSGEFTDGEIWSMWDTQTDKEILSYLCPISDDKELYVRVTVGNGYADILCWQMMDIGEWEFDASVDVWLGEDFDEVWKLG